MTETLIHSEAPAGPSHRRAWIIGALVVLVVGAAAMAAAGFGFRYLHARPLEHDGGSTGWLSPDDGLAHDVTAGRLDANVVAERRGQQQSFEVSIHNGASVTQTVLGLARTGVTSQREFVSVSTAPEGGPKGQWPPHFTRRPVPLPPGSDYVLRYTVTDSTCWPKGRSDTYQDLALHVRVGAFTRQETIHFGDQTSFVVVGNGKC